MPAYYAYRIFPPDRIEDRLNEARERGWSLHTFTDANDEEWASAVFQCVNLQDSKDSPFADDNAEHQKKP